MTPNRRAPAYGGRNHLAYIYRIDPRIRWEATSLGSNAPHRTDAAPARTDGGARPGHALVRDHRGARRPGARIAGATGREARFELVPRAFSGESATQTRAAAKACLWLIGTSELPPCATTSRALLHPAAVMLPGCRGAAYALRCASRHPPACRKAALSAASESPGRATTRPPAS